MSGHNKWSTIKHKKGRADAKRGKLFTKLIREITVSAREAGGDESANPRLRSAIAAAKAANMPADNIKRAIQRGTGELPGVNYEEISFEGYGPGGVAVMLELARVLARQPQPRSVVFVAFSGEETGRLGSIHYVQNAAAYPAGKIIAMLNLDTVGRLGDNPVTVFGAGSAEEWVHIFRGASHVTGVGVKPVDDDFGSSDQSSFIAAGVPAVQLFGSLHADIHRPGDTLDKIDVSGLVKVTQLLNEAALYLAGRPQPLSSKLAGAPQAEQAAVPGKRRVSLGTVPDFGFSGPGVRLEDVRADSPAALAGLQSGDVIIGVNEGAVDDMRDYAAALKRLRPGDQIRVRIIRAGAEQTVTARVVER